jgi:K+-sensing histidine kinase KdpD
LLLTAILALFRTGFANTDAALALIAVVVAIAANGHRLAGYLAALSSAAWFDFFLAHPYTRFSITGRTDVETTILLVVIGVAVTEIAVWGRRGNETASRRAGYLDGIRSAAAAVAAGKSPPDMTDHVSDLLVRLLSLRTCRFQHGIAGLGNPLRLQHDGGVTSGGNVWGPETRGLPEGSELELLVESGGLLWGRFLTNKFVSSWTLISFFG